MGLTDDQKEEYAECFKLFDKDDKGVIATDELGSVVRALGLSPSQAQVEEMKKKADPGGKGTVGVEAVFTVMDGHNVVNEGEDALLEAFQIFDNAGNGTIPATELKAIFKNMGEPFSEEEADAMVAAADVDSKGNIKYEDFLKQMLSA
jgi:calmodulin